MKVTKFYAATTREALRQVREALGADAIILSNRSVDGGIEIMAVAEKEVEELTAEAPAAIAAPSPSAPKAATKPGHLRPESEEDVPPLRYQRPEQEAAQAAHAAATAHQQTAVLPDQVVMEMVREMKFLRGMLEGQLAGLAWGDLNRREPVKVELLRSMLSAGFGPALSRQLSDHAPAARDFSQGMAWIKAALAHNIQTVKPGRDLLEQGGVYALVGPTGVGKTTTVAKLAARCALANGPARVALLTTDNYRIGAHEQLRIYGKILGVPVHAVRDVEDLHRTLADFRHKHLVLIDTVGMSQRDIRLAEQIALLRGDGGSVKRLLLLGATAASSTLDDVIRSYQQAGGVDGCILTKLDEASSLGGVLDAVIRHRLEVHCVTNGQRVPEDLFPANALYLVDRALKAVQPSSEVLEETEYPLIMAGFRPQPTDLEKAGYGG